RSSPALVPIFTPPTSETETKGTVYVWIGALEGDDLEVGLDDETGPWFEPLGRGKSGAKKQDNVEVTIINQAPVADITRGGRGAVVVIDGRWALDRQFSVRLAGHGTASIWVQSEGDLAPDVSYGAMVPRAFKEGTITIPASSPDLIAAGATLNRSDWTDYEGNQVSFPDDGALDQAPLDSIAFYSSAGPNALGQLKPDIVAPGANVIGAMAHFADPRLDPTGGTFAAFGRCTDGMAEQCFVVDDYHAATSGTSMSSPIVAGAVALLLERDPTLTQPQVRALLQAGARPLEGVIFTEQQAGPGALDLEGTLLAQIAENSPGDRLPGSKSWISLAMSYAKPDENEALRGFVELRDDELEPADAFEAARLSLSVDHGTLVLPLTRLAAGLYSFAVSAPSGSGGGELGLRLYFDGTLLVSRRVPIAVDHAVSEQGVAARGGCSIPARVPSSPWLALFAAGSGFGLLRRRRSKLR
ncbi:MAG TPA: S8 family serine peptidase, partial [Polyangiaceae bacterium]|nr:S8 family serine peptidase [Polyangiaceae bacterium]